MLGTGPQPRWATYIWSVLCAIPEESELPESGVTGILLNKEAARVAVDGTITLTARVRPQCHQSGSQVLFRSYHCHGG